MTLREKQSKFVQMVALLIQFAYEKGYELTLGDAAATSGHRRNSCHYIRLAVDLNIFREGKYLSSTEDHQELGKFWESIGGSWGGRFDDGNHYSLEHEGRK
ncbi:MAG: M15 family metallopeptidase [Gammaproteobacteria bacterium]|nr:M15 family metallopeptidase [Gammaproteobacteria bacterium]